MILYHGSNVEIDEVDLSRSNPYKDFGRGFYLTSLRVQAEKMAMRTSRFYGGTPVVTAFEAPDDILENSSLRVRVFEGVSEEWAVFVINNRDRRFADIASEECNADCKYDVVYGPVGNDDVTLLLRQFARGYIDERRLKEGLAYKRASDQFSFHTPRAVALLSKVGAWHVL
ncbi:DUF3990 domain-containing protein [Adlercreutzia sp. ZJ473]|uniref:DUF3990 domain-containing protein n=1 Tax=Adlercreutzia sp. ZJ473 TaxID=2722822 RepID=UPI001556BEB2|nr:DUF3990 domain-containing protein [Adlercreutzia sp. ZJ473]